MCRRDSQEGRAGQRSAHPIIDFCGELVPDPEGCGKDETGLGLGGDIGLDFSPVALMLVD